MIGAGGGPQTFAWIARHADGWMTTPQQTDITGQIEAAGATELVWGVPDRSEAEVVAHLDRLAARLRP